MKRIQKTVVKLWAETGHSGCMPIIMGVAIVLSGAFFSYGTDVAQYWTLEEVSGAIATNAVVGGNNGALVNFAGGGWDTDTPDALSHSTGSLAFDSSKAQYINGGYIGLSSLKLNKGATVSV